MEAYITMALIVPCKVLFRTNAPHTGYSFLASVEVAVGACENKLSSDSGSNTAEDRLSSNSGGRTAGGASCSSKPGVTAALFPILPGNMPHSTFCGSLSLVPQIHSPSLKNKNQEIPFKMCGCFENATNGDLAKLDIICS